MTPAPQIALAVPGAWRSRDTIALAIAERSRGAYRLANDILVTPDGEQLLIDIVDFNPRLRDGFAEASGGEFSEDLLDLVDDHAFTLNLSAPTGDSAHLKRVMRAGLALLEAGGMALMVLNSGMAHTAQAWAELCEAEAPGCFIRAFVQTLEKDDHTFLSLGMHNLALPDAYLEGDTNPSRAIQLVDRFLHYLVEKRPALHEGEFFRFSENEPPYQLSRRRKSEFPPGDHYYNPLGYWQLQRAQID